MEPYLSPSETDIGLFTGLPVFRRTEAHSTKEMCLTQDHPLTCAFTGEGPCSACLFFETTCIPNSSCHQEDYRPGATGLSEEVQGLRIHGCQITL